MKKTQITKILVVIILLFLEFQVIHAESYQRWIYWTSSPKHQVDAEEMAEIVSGLYSGKFLPDEVFKLSTGTSLRIPQPTLYLRYIKKAVRSIDPTLNTKEEIVKAISKSEKMRWGNDVAVLVKNYWVSDKLKKVVATSDYSGEGKGTDFLFINGIPFIKCDCGNPLEPINIVVPVVEEEKEKQQSEPTELIKNGLNKEEKDPGFPKDLGRAVLGMKTKTNTQMFPEEKNGNPWLWKKVPNWMEPIIVAGVSFLTYKAGEYAWYHWIKTPVPPPQTIWMDPPLDGKKSPGLIQPKGNFTLSFSIR